jgi:hypothetical protein
LRALRHQRTLIGNALSKSQFLLRIHGTQPRVHRLV